MTSERGATLIEFAIAVPVVMTLVMGMFTGGIAYNQQSSLTYAAREAARYGATLPKAQYATATEWLTAVQDTAVDRADGVLDDGSASVCVAIVNGTASPPAVSGGYTTNGGQACFDDGAADGSERVQVVVRRAGEIDALVWSRTVTIRSRATSRFES